MSSAIIKNYGGVPTLFIDGVPQVEMAYMTYFTVENIRFDFNYGNPVPVNMDGVHVDGGCHFGYIHNITGSLYVILRTEIKETP